MRELVLEICQSLRKNKLRTALTGFAIFWGISMLIVLLGAGNGMINAVNENSKAFGGDIVLFFPGYTSKAYRGQSKYRRIRYDKMDINMLKAEFGDNLINIEPVFEGTETVLYSGAKSIIVDPNGVSSTHLINGYPMKTIEGRPINHTDVRNMYKVMVIDEDAAYLLFTKHGKKAVGSYVKLFGSMFQVVGIIAERKTSPEMNVFIPNTTWANILHTENDFTFIEAQSVGLNTEEEIDRFRNNVKNSMARIHNYSPDDNGAIWVYVPDTKNSNKAKMQLALTIAIWVIGILTLLSGVVGVTNIMLISVKERTKEIGIRKALGAKSRSILWMIISESIAITSFFGYLGVVVGVLVTEYMDKVIGEKVIDGGIFQFVLFKDPTIDLSIAVEAVVFLVIAGTIAGLFPAIRALRIKPIEALNAR